MHWLGQIPCVTALPTWLLVAVVAILSLPPWNPALVHCPGSSFGQICRNNLRAVGCQPLPASGGNAEPWLPAAAPWRPIIPPKNPRQSCHPNVDMSSYKRLFKYTLYYALYYTLSFLGSEVISNILTDKLKVWKIYEIICAWCVNWGRTTNSNNRSGIWI